VAVLAAVPEGGLVTVAKRGGPAEGREPTTTERPATVPTGASTVAVMAEGPAVPVGALVPATESGRPTRSWEAAVAWTLMGGGGGLDRDGGRGMSTAAEATVTTSMNGGVATSKSRVDADRVIAGNPGRRWASAM
jgi:hypothetical protein